jgi:hypothetical protein
MPAASGKRTARELALLARLELTEAEADILDRQPASLP